MPSLDLSIYTENTTNNSSIYIYIIHPPCIVIQMIMMMGQEAKLVSLKEVDEAKHRWVFMESGRCDDDFPVSSFSGGSDESATSDSSSSSSSSSSSDLMEDASSTPSLSNGPLYEFSQLMSHLPIKRGLSKYYKGKSQSFKSLAIVRNAEDLVKKECPYKKKRKSKSYGDMINKHSSYSPKPTIAKKVPRGRSFLSSSIFTNTPLPLQKIL